MFILQYNVILYFSIQGITIKAEPLELLTNKLKELVGSENETVSPVPVRRRSARKSMSSSAAPNPNAAFDDGEVAFNPQNKKVKLLDACELLYHLYSINCSLLA